MGTQVADPSRLAEALARGRARRQLPAPGLRRHLRTAAGLSQDDAVDAIGALCGYRPTREALSRWEAGSRTPSGQLLGAYLELLDVLASEVRGRGHALGEASGGAQ